MDRFIMGFSWFFVIGALSGLLGWALYLLFTVWGWWVLLLILGYALFFICLYNIVRYH